MNLHLPARVKLDELVTDSGHDMHVTCEDIGAFLEGVGALQITHKLAKGSFLMKLCAAMAARGMVMDVKACPHERTQLQRNPSGGDASRSECPYGCCTACLQRAGIMPSY